MTAVGQKLLIVSRPLYISSTSDSRHLLAQEALQLGAKSRH